MLDKIFGGYTMNNSAVIGIIALALSLVGQPLLADSHAMSTEEVLNHHLTAFGTGDLEGMLSDYTDESVLILPDVMMTGPDEMKPAFEAFIAEFSQEGTEFNLTHTNVHNNVAHIVWTAETPDNSYQFATDTFVIEDGKILSQTLTMVVVPK
jgi:ketosteroid isomerase-like protein